MVTSKPKIPNPLPKPNFARDGYGPWGKIPKKNYPEKLTPRQKAREVVLSALQAIGIIS